LLGPDAYNSYYMTNPLARGDLAKYGQPYANAHGLPWPPPDPHTFPVTALEPVQDVPQLYPAPYRTPIEEEYIALRVKDPNLLTEAEYQNLQQLSFAIDGNMQPVHDAIGNLIMGYAALRSSSVWTSQANVATRDPASF